MRRDDWRDFLESGAGVFGITLNIFTTWIDFVDIAGRRGAAESGGYRWRCPCLLPELRTLCYGSQVVKRINGNLLYPFTGRRCKARRFGGGVAELAGRRVTARSWMDQEAPESWRREQSREQKK